MSQSCTVNWAYLCRYSVIVVGTSSRIDIFSMYRVHHSTLTSTVSTVHRVVFQLRRVPSEASDAAKYVVDIATDLYPIKLEIGETRFW